VLDDSEYSLTADTLTVTPDVEPPSRMRFCFQHFAVTGDPATAATFTLSRWRLIPKWQSAVPQPPRRWKTSYGSRSDAGGLSTINVANRSRQHVSVAISDRGAQVSRMSTIFYDVSISANNTFFAANIGIIIAGAAEGQCLRN
jgi:hypothetical protein